MFLQALQLVRAASRARYVDVATCDSIWRAVTQAGGLIVTTRRKRSEAHKALSTASCPAVFRESQQHAFREAGNDAFGLTEQQAA